MGGAALVSPTHCRSQPAMAASLSSTSFRTVSVKDKVSIKKFVQDSGLSFQKGSGYYQLTKPEVIQDYKKVVARRKVDGIPLFPEMLSRKFLELNPV